MKSMQPNCILTAELNTCTLEFIIAKPIVDINPDLQTLWTFVDVLLHVLGNFGSICQCLSKESLFSDNSLAGMSVIKYKMISSVNLSATALLRSQRQGQVVCTSLALLHNYWDVVMFKGYRKE